MFEKLESCKYIVYKYCTYIEMQTAKYWSLVHKPRKLYPHMYYLNVV
jgi:hypothetical protein